MDLYVGENTHMIELTGLTLQPDGSKVNGATVTADIREKDSGDRPTGLSSEISLTADQNTDGRYDGTLDASVELGLYTQYEVTVTADNGTESAEWTEVVVATEREFND